jgi:hypothetical protein
MTYPDAINTLPTDARNALLSFAQRPGWYRQNPLALAAVLRAMAPTVGPQWSDDMQYLADCLDMEAKRPGAKLTMTINMAHGDMLRLSATYGRG